MRINGVHFETISSRLSRMIIMATFSIYVAGCTSSPDKRRGDRSREQPAHAIGLVASPVAVLFATMDTNNDRVISQSEINTGLASEWSFADTDANGSVTPFEASNWAKASLGSTTALPNRLSFDTDLNAIVTELEFSQRIQLEFDLLDLDHNAELTRDELFFRFKRPDFRLQQDRQGRPERGRGREGRGGRG